MKPRFATLDGLRGVCAIAVLLLHAPMIGDGRHRLFPSGFIAVDLFFVMSGFVLTYAYGRRFGPGYAWAFLGKRFRRLAPTWWLGIPPTLAILLVERFPDGAGATLRTLALTALMLPAWLPRTEAIFPYNGPGWSLFLELAINVAFAGLLYRLRSRSLALVALAAALACCAGAGLRGSVNSGFEWPTLDMGLWRVVYGFLAGVLIFRGWTAGAITRSTSRALLLLAAALAVFTVPDRTAFVAVQVAAMLLLAPAIVYLAARTATGAGVAAAFEALGRLSYPLYAIHYPLLFLARHVWIWAFGPNRPIGPGLIYPLCLLIVAAAYVVGTVLDPAARPVILAPRRRKRAPPGAADDRLAPDARLG